MAGGAVERVALAAFRRADRSLVSHRRSTITTGYARHCCCEVFSHKIDFSAKFKRLHRLLLSSAFNAKGANPISSLCLC